MNPISRLAALLTVAALLTGCAALNTVTSDVTTYSEWPQERKPASYAFERLPSQKANAQRQATLETAAASALEKAGFKAAADPAQADVIVQVGARVSRTEVSPWDDPLWWRWGPSGYWRAPAWRYGPRSPFYAGLNADWYSRYERSVALLLRDRASNTPLFEAHAQTEGASAGDAALLGAMFEAALQGFPAKDAANPRRVSVQLAP
jgi:predicted HNH restriction endonuclease